MTSPTPPRTKAQQREETTRALVSSARHLFAQHGYAQVSLAQVVADAGVTKGALYHHFRGKDDLFAAVSRQAHQEVGDRVAAAADAAGSAGAELWEQFLTGCRTFLTASTEAHIRQVMLIDSPSVLGWSAWRRLDASTSRQHLEEALTELVAEGVVEPQPVAPLVHLLSGAMNEAALWLADTDEHREQALDDAMAALTRMLDALRA